MSHNGLVVAKQWSV